MANPNNPKNNKAQAKSSGTFSNLFGGHEKKGPAPEVVSMRHDINSLSRRIRELEERAQNLRKKVQMTDYTQMNQNKRYQQEIKVINSEINDLRHIMNDLDNKMLLLIKELRMCAKKEDVKVLNKYIGMWEPINFVTRKEVENIVRDAIEELGDKLKKR